MLRNHSLTQSTLPSSQGFMTKLEQGLKKTAGTILSSIFSGKSVSGNRTANQENSRASGTGPLLSKAPLSGPLGRGNSSLMSLTYQ